MDSMEIGKQIIGENGPFIVTINHFVCRWIFTAN